MKVRNSTPPLLNRIRLAIGLRWRSARPSPADLREALRNAALALGLLFVFGVVGRLDYETERAIEMEARADRLASRAALAGELQERYRTARNDAEHYEDYVIACIRGDREWVLAGQRWECNAKPVGPYIPQQEN